MIIACTLWRYTMSEAEDVASCIAIEDEETLRSRYASPRFLPVLDQLDRSCRLFIAHSPVVIIGTTQPDNGIDISPRGDAPGFVRVLDEHTLSHGFQIDHGRGQIAVTEPQLQDANVTDMILQV